MKTFFCQLYRSFAFHPWKKRTHSYSFMVLCIAYIYSHTHTYSICDPFLRYVVGYGRGGMKILNSVCVRCFFAGSLFQTRIQIDPHFVDDICTIKYEFGFPEWIEIAFFFVRPALPSPKLPLSVLRLYFRVHVKYEITIFRTILCALSSILLHGYVLSASPAAALRIEFCTKKKKMWKWKNWREKWFKNTNIYFV